MTDVDRYLILIEGAPRSNFSAWSPEVQGCVATGETIDACVLGMREALAEHLEALAADGEPAPVPAGPGVYVDRAIAA